MDQSALSQTLQTLAKASKGRSKAARLRDVLGDVEAALAAGVTHVAVIAALKQQGLDMTLGTFQGTLKRLRMQSAKRLLTQPPIPPAALPVAPRQSQASHDPADLDKIFRSVPDTHALAKAGRERQERLKKK
jgi:hypothetical protein